MSSINVEKLLIVKYKKEYHEHLQMLCWELKKNARFLQEKKGKVNFL